MYAQWLQTHIHFWNFWEISTGKNHSGRGSSTEVQSTLNPSPPTLHAFPRLEWFTAGPGGSRAAGKDSRHLPQTGVWQAVEAASSIPLYSWSLGGGRERREQWGKPPAHLSFWAVCEKQAGAALLPALCWQALGAEQRKQRGKTPPHFSHQEPVSAPPLPSWSMEEVGNSCPSPPMPSPNQQTPVLGSHRSLSPRSTPSGSQEGLSWT